MTNWKRLAVIAGLLLGSFVLARATIIGALPYTLTNGSTADATQVMANYTKIITDTNANAAHNGVNSDITALTALSTPITSTQGGTTTYIGGTSTGTANAQVVATPVPTGMTLAAGQTVCFIAGATNTAATTLNANALGAKNVFRQSPSGVQALTGGEIVSGAYNCASYDGTEFVLNDNAMAAGIGPVTNLASAGTTDLGTIPSHNVNVTGTTGITAFGSSASASFPVYSLKFAGILTITYNASSMITPGARDIKTAANDTANALYLGSGNWQILNYTPAAQPPSMALATPSAVGLIVTNNVATPNTKIDELADFVVMTDTNGYGVAASTVSVTINFGTTGANGIDTGSQNTATWYYTYLIEKPDGTVAGLGSASATAPTMPAGYVYKMRTGAVFSNGSTQFLRTKQYGSQARYVVSASPTANLPIAISGTSGSTTTPTWTAQSLSALVPPTATLYDIGLFANQINGANSVMAAPNNSYGAAASTSNPPPLTFSSNNTSQSDANIQGRFANEQGPAVSPTVYYASGLNNSGLFVIGWVDKVNAS